MPFLIGSFSNIAGINIRPIPLDIVENVEGLLTKGIFKVFFIVNFTRLIFFNDQLYFLILFYIGVLEVDFLVGLNFFEIVVIFYLRFN